MGKIDKSSFSIVQCKVFANGEKYFSLFDSHIPTLDASKKCLVYAIDNIDCISKIIWKNPCASYVMYGDRLVNTCVKSMFPSVETIDETPENRKAYNIDMNFDCIIMNPPYERNLHLKILAEAIKHLKDNNSQVINLSPVRWLQDPFAPSNKKSDYCKFENSISKRIKSLDIISNTKVTDIFDAAFTMNLGIYTCNQTGGYIYYHNNLLVKKIIDKINLSNWSTYSYSKQYKLQQKPYKLIVSGIHFLNAKHALLCNTYESQLKTKAPNPTSHNSNNVGLFSFDSEEERLNFYNCYCHPFIDYICSWWRIDVHINTVKVPYFEDYTHSWDYEDFYKFFGITDDEKKIIEEAMAKYVEK